jgi:hypothetical protein
MLKLFAISALVLAFSLGSKGQGITAPLLQEIPVAAKTPATSNDEHATANAAEDEIEDVDGSPTPPLTRLHPFLTREVPVIASIKPLFPFADVEENAKRAQLFIPPAKLNGNPGGKPAPQSANGNHGTGFGWRRAVSQQLLFLGIQHGYAFTQPKTRRELKGPFIRDYFRSVARLDKWDDGGRFFTNYIAHPLQGSFNGFIQIQNDPRGSKQQFGRSKAYWRSRMKAMLWSAAWSTQFEIGPLSQASIGNVGLKGKQTWVDIVITPTAGTVLLIGEDALERYVVRWIERRTGNFYAKIAGRMLLNPTRTCANLIRFKKPWYRDK